MKKIKVNLLLNRNGEAEMLHECDTPYIASLYSLLQTRRRRDRVAPLFCPAIIYMEVIQKSEKSRIIKLHLSFSLFLSEWVLANSPTLHGLPMASILVWNHPARPPEIFQQNITMISEEVAVTFHLEQCAFHRLGISILHVGH